MKFLSVLAMAAAVSAAAVAPRDEWNGWGAQTSTVTVTSTVTATKTVTNTATVTATVTNYATITKTATSTVTVTVSQQGWGGWNPKE